MRSKPHFESEKNDKFLYTTVSLSREERQKYFLTIKSKFTKLPLEQIWPPRARMMGCSMRHRADNVTISSRVLLKHSTFTSALGSVILVGRSAQQRIRCWIRYWKVLIAIRLGAPSWPLHLAQPRFRNSACASRARCGPAILSPENKP